MRLLDITIPVAEGAIVTNPEPSRSSAAADGSTAIYGASGGGMTKP
jgi:hypothetical protein